MNKSVNSFFLIVAFVMASVSAHAEGARVAVDAMKKSPPAVKRVQQEQAKPLIPRVSFKPVITISSPPADGATISSPNVSFTLTCNKPATICWELDGGAQTCSAPQVTSFRADLVNLSQGNHTLEVTAIDSEVNTAISTRVWRVVFP